MVNEPMPDEAIKEAEVLIKTLIEPELDPDMAIQLFDNCPDGIVVVDRPGTIRFVNQQTTIMFGYVRLELIGQSIEMLLPDQFRARHAEHRKSYTEDPRIRPMGNNTLEIKGLTKDGRTIDVDISLCPIVTKHGNFYGAYIKKKRQ